MNLFPFFTLFYKECRRFFRIIGQSILTPLVTSSLYLLIFGVSLSKALSFFSLNYLQFIIPGLIMMGAINNAYLNSASSLIIAKYYGDVEDLKICPLSPFVIVNAMALASTIRAIIVGLTIFFVGEIFSRIYLHQTLFPNSPFLALYFLCISGLSFGILGVAVGCIGRTFEALNSVSQFILLPLTYLGGVFYSIDFLPPFWQKIALFNPMLYYIDGIRYAFFSVSEIPVFQSFLLTIIFFTLFYLGGYVIVSKSSFRRV